MDTYEEITLYGYNVPASVLVMRNDRIGDLVLALPLLRAIKAAFPEIKLGVLTSDYAAPVLEKDGGIDRLFTQGQPDLPAALKAEKFDSALVLWATYANAMLAWRAGILKRYGSNGRWFSPLFNRRLNIRRSDGIRSEAEYNLDFLRAMGAPVKDIVPRLVLEKRDEEEAHRWIRRHLPKGPGPVVMLHPGSGGSAQNWPPERYGALADALVARYKARIVVTGSLKEQGLVEKVAASMKSRASLMRQELSLRGFAALLGKAGLFVSASTGPMHLAAAMGSPTLSLFPCVRAMSPLRWAPRGNRNAVLTPPGLGFDLPGGNSFNFTGRISVDQASDAAAFLLRE